MSYRNSIRRSLWLEFHTFSLHPLFFLRRLWPACLWESILWVIPVVFLLYGFLPGWSALPITLSSGFTDNLSTYLRSMSPAVYIGAFVWLVLIVTQRSYATERIHTAHREFLLRKEDLDRKEELTVAPRQYVKRMLAVNALCVPLSVGVGAGVLATLLLHLPLWVYPLWIPLVFLIGMLHTGLRGIMTTADRLTWHTLFQDFTHQTRWGAILTVSLLHGIILTIVGTLLFLPLIPVLPAWMFDAKNQSVGEPSGIPPIVPILCLILTWISGAVFSVCRLILYRATLYLR